MTRIVLRARHLASLIAAWAVATSCTVENERPAVTEIDEGARATQPAVAAATRPASRRDPY